MKIQYLFVVSLLFFALGASCQKADTIMEEDNNGEKNPVAICSTPLECFDQCSQKGDKNEIENCYFVILNEQSESFCDTVKEKSLCQDFYLWQKAELDSDCASIKTSMWQKNCAESFADTQALFNKEDFDKDGLPNVEEMELGTDFRKADTDGDGYSDYEEVQAGFDPLTASLK